jgi:hypothetical protein
MQSTASESFARALRNPTVLAMLGSAGVHIVLVMISALKPAESQPQRFQIVNLPPKASTNRLATNPLATNPKGSNLPVPNGLPPVSLGDIPQLGSLPDLSTFRLPPSQSSFSGTRPGSSPSRIDLNKLRTMDLPQRSFSPTPPRPKSVPSVPNGATPLQPPETAQLPNVDPSGNGSSSPSSTNASQFSANNSRLSSLPSTPFSAREVLGLYGQQPSPSAPPDTSNALSNPPGTESSSGPTSGASPETNSLDPRTKLARVVANQRLSVVQELSIQKGPQLTAAYPLESCSSQKNGSAVVYALYERDGSVSKRIDAIQVLESAPDIAMNQAAIAAVSAYRPEARGIYQALTFNVDIPYSTAACQAAQPKPSPTQSPKANKKPASPDPVATPSNLPSASPQSPSLTPTPTQPSPSPFPSPSQSAPTANPVPSSVSEPSPVPSSAPTLEAPSPSPSPSPESPPPSPMTETTPSAPSPEPVPSPSTAVPEGTPTPVATPSTTP